jgi:tellurite resistance protein TerC
LEHIVDFSIILIIIQLIFLEGILSIDNAAILGAMVARLPSNERVPWPKALSGVFHHLDRLLGPQRVAALRVGLLGAYVGRGLMLLMASLVIRNPWLKIIGALYLIRLAFDDLAAPGGEGEEEEGNRPVKNTSFWITVLNVEIMDLVFSLDNVVAAVSLSDKIWVVMIGVAIGILAMRFAAGAFSYLVEREPILKSAAYVLVLNIGIQLIVEEYAHINIADWLRFLISISIILIALAYSHVRLLRIVMRPVLIWLSQGLALINALIAWLLVPFKSLLNLVLGLFRRPEESPTL